MQEAGSIQSHCSRHGHNVFPKMLDVPPSHRLNVGLYTVGSPTLFIGNLQWDFTGNINWAETLKRHLHDMKKKGLALGLGDAPSYLFTDRKGGPIDKNNWRRRVFNKALVKAGLRKVRIHDIRHGYATMRISQGHNIADVSKQLGHHSIKLTLDTYFHWIPGGNKNEVDALDDFFEGQKKVVDGV